VALLDHADRAGKKILISGGGRCNFTNLHTQPDNFLSENPHFAKSALARFTPEDMVALVEKHGIRFHEKTLGQLFCDRSALEMVTMLERECTAAGVHVFLRTQISSVSQGSSQIEGFLIETSEGSFRSESLVVATGGLSIPKMGATGLGYGLAQQFGMRVVDCRPGLVPLVFSEEDQDRWCDLTGLSVEVTAAAGTGKRAASFREKMLITHRGLSGPAMLQVSSYWKPGTALQLDLAPGRNVTAPLLEQNARRDPGTALRVLHTNFPGRLADRWFDVHPPADWTNASLAAMEQQIHSWQVTPAGTEGYTKAEVTAGGVDTAELDAKTLQSRKVPGLFFIGEVVDVTGWLGGYNFQWAWASGVSAGQAV
jgi:predicted Rossmann fold flavoprotein